MLLNLPVIYFLKDKWLCEREILCSLRIVVIPEYSCLFQCAAKICLYFVF